MMMSANLVGFALGLDGLKGLVSGIGGSLAGWGVLVGACGALYTGAQVMFEWREREKRGGRRDQVLVGGEGLGCEWVRLVRVGKGRK